MVEPTRDHTSEQDRSGESGERVPRPALAHEVRRSVLDVLADGTDPVSVEEVASRLVASDDVDRRDPASERRLRSRLHHCHLPMLADAGFLEYDPGSNRVVPVDAHPPTPR